MKKGRAFCLGLALLVGLGILLQQGCAPKPTVTIAPRAKPVWFGFHVLMERKNATETLLKEIPALAKLGVNLLIIEVDYNYEYVSHPELRGDAPLSKEDVKKIVALCRDNKIRVMPEFQSLGHQSWEEKTYPLLIKYPQFDETPGQYPGNKDIYCRSWCPLHPDVNPIIFDLYDELIDAFEADALHVGMDEVFLIASDYCPRCKGKNPADLFAKAVNDLYDHIVKKRGLEMMMWGDRLIDGAATGYGEWEASMNKTYPAVDMIPKDIIICDWHYEKGKTYPSIPLFLDKGFRVLPTSFRNVKNLKGLMAYSFTFSSDRMLGHLCTIWGEPKENEAKNRALVAAAKELRKYKLL
jgi:Glycosyl hydrolase family 20, catalytic domain